MSKRQLPSHANRGSNSPHSDLFADLTFDHVLFGSPYSTSSSLSRSPSDRHHSPISTFSVVPTQVIPSGQRSPPPRGGCWTCRLRRKKCDEQRAEDGTCATCRRLKLKCLGWGARRPDWMRDKEEVTRYKAEIKAHLLRQGLIRGQPRAGFLSSSESRPTSRRTATSTVHPYTRPNHNHNATITSSRFEHTYSLQDFTASAATFHASGMTVPALVNDENTLYYDITSTTATTTPPLTVPSLDSSAFGVQQPGSDDPRQSLVSYYFSDVRALNFAHMCITARTALWQSLVKVKDSALESALCAIADVFFQWEENRVRLPGSMYSETHLSQFYFNEALLRLDASRSSGRLGSADAVAAGHLAAYCLATTGGTAFGGVPRWMHLLETGNEYTAQVVMRTDLAPRRSIRDMPIECSLAVKVSMCMDMMLGVALNQPPRLLALWRNILGSSQNVDLYISRLVGCEDAVFLAFGEIAALAHWKKSEEHKGTLNMRDLFDRASVIQRLLQQHADPVLSGAPPGRQGQADDQINMMMGGVSPPAGVDEQICRRLVARVWWDAAMLYLGTVIHGTSTTVEGTVNSVGAVVQRLAVLPTTGLDRALVAPLMLTAAAADLAEHRTALLTRLVKIDGSSTNLRQAEAVLREVWRRRDATGAAIDWRDVMRESGLILLLV